jgi:hypothetical protein
MTNDAPPTVVGQPAQGVPLNALRGVSMSASDLVIPPPTPKLIDYPGSIGVGLIIIFTTVLLGVAGRFDPTGGTLTLSLMVTLAFIGVVVVCMFFTGPNSEVTAGVVGGLTAAFGAVIAHWLGRTKEGPKG